MKHLKKCFIFLLTLVFAIGIAGTPHVTAEAKNLKTKKITLYDRQTKTIKTPKKIASIDVDINIPVKKTGAKKFKVTGYPSGDFDEPVCEDTIFVTYTNGDKQTYKVLVIDRYAEKIVNELKPLLADPDNGIRMLAEKYYPGDKVMEDGTVYKRQLIRRLKKNDGKGVDAVGYYAKQTLDEMLSSMTVSQKEAAILQLFFTHYMTYNYGDYMPGTGTYECIYKGTFKGVCGESACMVYGLCKMLGYDARLMSSVTAGMAHQWACVAAVDADGKKYWEGIDGSSYACNVKWKYKGIRLSEYDENDIMLDYTPKNYCDIAGDKFSYETVL